MRGEVRRLRVRVMKKQWGDGSQGLNGPDVWRNMTDGRKRAIRLVC